MQIYLQNLTLDQYLGNSNTVIATMYDVTPVAIWKCAKRKKWPIKQKGRFKLNEQK
jgi:hypothetical protein